MLSELFQFMIEIENNHKNFSKVFAQTHEIPNLNHKKNARLDRFIIDQGNYDDSFISLLHEYLDSLDLEQIACVAKYASNLNLECRWRIKQFDSLLNKLFVYRFQSEESNFKKPVIKAVDDLLGFRVIVDTPQSYEDILKALKENDKNFDKRFRSKPKNPDKTTKYTALHIHFRGDTNRYFPWELQIWKKSDEKENIESHAEHKNKRQYTEWYKSYRENEHREEE